MNLGGRALFVGVLLAGGAVILSGCTDPQAQIQEDWEDYADRHGISTSDETVEPVIEEGPLCPIPTDEWEHRWGVDPGKVGPLVVEWINAHPVEQWPVSPYSSDEEQKDTSAVTDQVLVEVFNPLGCDDSTIDMLADNVVRSAYTDWQRALHPERSLPAEPQPSDGSDGTGRCRVGFGTGGFFWSCSVSS